MDIKRYLWVFCILLVSGCASMDEKRFAAHIAQDTGIEASQFYAEPLSSSFTVTSNTTPEGVWDYYSVFTLTDTELFLYVRKNAFDESPKLHLRLAYSEMRGIDCMQFAKYGYQLQILGDVGILAIDISGVSNETIVNDLCDFIKSKGVSEFTARGRIVIPTEYESIPIEKEDIASQVTADAEAMGINIIEIIYGTFTVTSRISVGGVWRHGAIAVTASEIFLYAINPTDRKLELDLRFPYSEMRGINLLQEKELSQIQIPGVIGVLALDLEDPEAAKKLFDGIKGKGVPEIASQETIGGVWTHYLPWDFLLLMLLFFGDKLIVF